MTKRVTQVQGWEQSGETAPGGGGEKPISITRGPPYSDTYKYGHTPARLETQNSNRIKQETE
jgi:hypothetical protein